MEKMRNMFQKRSTRPESAPVSYIISKQTPSSAPPSPKTHLSSQPISVVRPDLIHNVSGSNSAPSTPLQEKPPPRPSREHIPITASTLRVPPQQTTSLSTSPNSHYSSATLPNPKTSNALDVTGMIQKIPSAGSRIAVHHVFHEKASQPLVQSKSDEGRGLQNSVSFSPEELQGVEVTLEGGVGIDLSVVESLRNEVAKLNETYMNSREEGRKLKIKMNEYQKMVDAMKQENKRLKTKLSELTTVIDEEGVLYVKPNENSTTPSQSVNGNPNGNLVNSKPLEIRGATLDKLIELLYLHDQSVTEFADTFLMTFRSFTTAQEVWSKLTTKYSACTKSVLTDIEELPPNENNIAIRIQLEQLEIFNQKIRLRIIVTLKHWAERHYFDFDEDLLRKFQQFIEENSANSEVGLLRKVLQIAEQRVTKIIVPKPNTNEPPPPSILPPVSLKSSQNSLVSLETLDPVEIARQLSITEWNIFHEIAPKELLSLSWQKEGKEMKSPNVLRLIDRFNQVSNWVTVTIVKEPDVKRRGKILKKFVLIGTELLKLRNFSGVFEIASALESSSISRLAKTWATLSPQKKKIYDKFLEVTSPSNNFSLYRESLSSNYVATVPYLGTFLSDLTFIEEGNNDFIDDTYVNFSKCQMVAEVIKQIQLYQQWPYNLTPVNHVVTYLNSHQVIDEKECYQLSLKVEPRVAK